MAFGAKASVVSSTNAVNVTTTTTPQDKHKSRSQVPQQKLMGSSTVESQSHKNDITKVLDDDPTLKHQSSKRKGKDTKGNGGEPQCVTGNGNTNGNSGGGAADLVDNNRSNKPKRQKRPGNGIT